jgi:hypothetical protein
MAETEQQLRERISLGQEINSLRADRTQLEKWYGNDQVWDAQELAQDFTVLAFLAPYVRVIRKADNKKGTLLFQHSPRFYFSFTQEGL